MKLTRPQRLRLAWVTFAVAAPLLLWMIWSPRLTSWTATSRTGGGTLVREFGMVRYLAITSQMSGPRGPSQTVLARNWNWKPQAVAINAGISIGLMLALGHTCRRMIRKDRLVDRCDECGYDLTGLHSQTCPECGSAVDVPDVARP